LNKDIKWLVSISKDGKPLRNDSVMANSFKNAFKKAEKLLKPDENEDINQVREWKKTLDE